MLSSFVHAEDNKVIGNFTRIKAETSRRWNVWMINRNQESIDHPAVFPESLAKDHIASWSNPGDIVCDPFSGSGTTCKAAKELERHWLGIEVNPAYVEISNARLSQDVLALFYGPLGGGGRGVSVAPAAEKRHNVRFSDSPTGSVDSTKTL